MAMEDFLGSVISENKKDSDSTDHFDKAILITLKHEGGFVNDPVDPGGATNWGMSIRFLKGAGDSDGDGFDDGDLDHDGDIDVDDIENMTVEQARKLYRIHFWDKYGYDKISDFTVAARCFDMTVNMGAKQTGKIVQRALNNLGNSLKVDGAIGKNTFATINCTDPEMLMSEIRQEHAQFYLNLIAAKPKFAKYKKGWLRRAAA
jgi:lysozyme family protein